MKKSDLVELIRSKGGYVSEAEAERALRAFTDAITEVLVKKESASIVGFGVFESKISKGREGTIPGTDRKYSTKDKHTPRFKAGKILKDSVEKGFL